jgi:hypothetical protein
LVVGIRIIRIDFDRIHELDRRLTVLAFFEVSLPVLEVLLLTRVRVTGARGQKKKEQEWKTNQPRRNTESHRCPVFQMF